MVSEKKSGIRIVLWGFLKKYKIYLLQESINESAQFVPP